MQHSDEDEDEKDPSRRSARPGPVALLIEPRATDLGEFSVRRALPASERRAVGPFVFFDHMGPAEFPPGKGIAVRPHPHIGLATLTYLFEGEIIHRDSLGVVQAIRPGAVNLMTAGRGIVHSERAGDDLAQTSRLHGIQSWLALPDEDKERAPDFAHYPADALPLLSRAGASVRVVMGETFGERSPVTCHSPTLYLDCHLEAGAKLALPADRAELAVYVVEGALTADGLPVAAGVMAVARAGRTLSLTASTASRAVVIGGAPLGPRTLWWNFVHSDPARIEAAREDWRAGRFAPVPGDKEFIPLPDGR